MVIRAAQQDQNLEWAGLLASMLQVSLVGFLVAGAALSTAYYDVALTFIAILSVLSTIVSKRAKISPLKSF
jgi:putative inorganic carbon (HCO3(-)) transporter